LLPFDFRLSVLVIFTLLPAPVIESVGLVLVRGVKEEEEEEVTKTLFLLRCCRLLSVPSLLAATVHHEPTYRLPASQLPRILLRVTA